MAYISFLEFKMEITQRKATYVAGVTFGALLFEAAPDHSRGDPPHRLSVSLKPKWFVIKLFRDVNSQRNGENYHAPMTVPKTPILTVRYRVTRARYSNPAVKDGCPLLP